MTFGVIKFNSHIVEIETLKRCIEDHTARKCNFRCPWDGSIIHIYYCNTKARVFKETCFYFWNYRLLTRSPLNPLGPGSPGIPGLPISPWRFRYKKINEESLLWKNKNNYLQSKTKLILYLYQILITKSQFLSFGIKSLIHLDILQTI